MIVATSILKPPKARTALKVLPRTIAWDNLFLIAAFAIIGLIVGLGLFSGNLQAILTSVAVGGLVGFIIPSLSPLEGESVLKWFGLQAQEATAQRVNINGRRAKMYIGTYPLKRVALGKARLLPSSGVVKASAYDERGYPELNTGKGNPQLEAQRKLRNQTRKKSPLRPSTSLAVPTKKKNPITGLVKGKRPSAGPKLPQARTTSVSSLTAGSNKKRKRGSSPSGKQKLRRK